VGVKYQRQSIHGGLLFPVGAFGGGLGSGVVNQNSIKPTIVGQRKVRLKRKKR